MKSFSSFTIKNTVLKNRLVMPPMCMYSAEITGLANEFHFQHYETRAVGGVGLIIVEATSVRPEGRISDRDLGIWSDEHIEPLRIIADKISRHDTIPGIQLAHAGRKSMVLNAHPVAPSPIAFDEKSRVPKELTVSEIETLVTAFKDAATRAIKAGFKFLEIHGAHGYLIHEFLSPISNHRNDTYGGSLDNRVKLLKEIIKAVKSVCHKDIILGLRVSATDYHEAGISSDDMVQMLNLVKEDLDIVHVSSGALINVPMTVYPGYQLKYAQQIRTECDIPTIGVGMLTSIEMSEEALGNDHCDLVAFGRLLLRNPYFPMQEAAKSGVMGMILEPYTRGF